MGSALVLGGGGVAGIAWTTGLLAGLAEAGTDVTSADLLLGTSAGANVAAQVGSGLPLPTLLARQTDPSLQAEEILPPAGVVETFIETWQRMNAERLDPDEYRRRWGAIGLSATTGSERDRRAVVESRLPSHDWPERRLVLTAVDAQTGELRLFDRASGVPLVDAVAASSAVPGVWPPATIGGHRYIDGGIRTIANADLAADQDRVLVIAPMSDDTLDDQIAALAKVTRVELVQPDEAAVEAIGSNALDPETRAPAARAGRAQAGAELPRVAALWTS